MCKRLEKAEIAENYLHWTLFTIKTFSELKNYSQKKIFRTNNLWISFLNHKFFYSVVESLTQLKNKNSVMIKVLKERIFSPQFFRNEFVCFIVAFIDLI